MFVEKTSSYIRSNTPGIDKQRRGAVLLLDLQGRWDTTTVSELDEEMRQLEDSGDKNIIIRLTNISRLDTAGAWLIERLYQHLTENKARVSFEGAKEGWPNLFAMVGKTIDNHEKEEPPAPQSFWVKRFFEEIGKRVVHCGHDFKVAMYILGSVIRGTQMRNKKKRGTVSMPALVGQMDKMGVGAVPIIILMSFIVGAIIAQQGAFQLRNFGAEIFTVDLLGILVFRELGVLLTAIMIAGRSGSAITAEIGSMRMREETDALQVMGLNPISVLVFPRLAALIIILPLLTVIADLAALVGGGLVANIYSGISVDAYVARLMDTVQLTTYFAGLIKAPFMAMIIGVIATVEGLKVGGSAESLGARVTSSVVKSIFLVIITDGFFAMFYAAINF